MSTLEFLPPQHSQSQKHLVFFFVGASSVAHLVRNSLWRIVFGFLSQVFYVLNFLY